MPTIFTVAQAALEKSTFLVTASFTDENGAAVAPKTLTWSLTKEDMTTIVNNRSEVAINTPSTAETIVLSGDDLTIEAGRSQVWRYLVVEGTYDGDAGNNLPLNDHLKFPIVNLAKVV